MSKNEVIEIPEDSGEKRKRILVRRWIIGLSIFLLLIVLVFSFVTTFFPEKETPKCGDGTFYDACSLTKPFFCSEGVLSERSQHCGCPDNQIKEGEFCRMSYFNNPKNVVLNYTLRGEEGEIPFTLYFGVYDYVKKLPRSISYHGDEVPLRSDFKLSKIDDEIQRQALLPLVVRIQNLAPNSKEDQARIAISLVQNIKYLEPEESPVLNGYLLRVARFPYQTFYEEAGSCEGKSELLAFLLRELDYGVALFYYFEENHEAVGIRCPVKESLENSGYCFVETTSPSILGDDGGIYLGTGKLYSSPEVVVINEGISLEGGMEEYRDAKVFRRISDSKLMNFLQKSKLRKLIEYYGLDIVF